MKPPWGSLLTSLPLWAIVVAHTSYTWGFFTMMTQLPSYMDEVLHFNLKNSAVISSLPYLAFTLVAFTSGFLADWIFKKNFLTITQIRKYFNNFALLCQMTFLLIAAFSTDKTIIIVCISLSVGLGGFITSGIFANTLDIAPQFSSIIYGISSTFAVIPGMVSPPLSGYIAVTPVSFDFGIVKCWISSYINHNNLLCFLTECQRIPNNISDSMSNLLVRYHFLWNLRIWRCTALGFKERNEK